MKKTMREEVDELLAEGVKINFLGRKDALSKKLIKEIELIEIKSRKNNNLVLNIAFNYGGRAEIVDAAKKTLFRLSG